MQRAVQDPGGAGVRAFDAVIFDCDGVLVDSEAIAGHLWAEMAGELGLTLDPSAALRAVKGGEMAVCVRWLEGLLGRAVPVGFVADFRARQVRRFESELSPVVGIEAVLDALTVPYCVASNGPREKMDVTLRVAGLLGYFGDRIYSAYEVGIFKPDPGLFVAAARGLGAAPERCAVVEDSLVGVDAGRAAGMTVFAYAEPHEREAFTDRGAVVFTEMAQLPPLLGAAVRGA